MPHHVFDVVAEDPEIEHVADQMHPASVQEPAGQERDGGRDADREGGRQIRLAEQQRRNRAILKDEGFGMWWGKTGLVKEDEYAEDDEGDRDDGSEFARVVVLERDHTATRLGIITTAVNNGSRQCGIQRQRSI